MKETIAWASLAAFVVIGMAIAGNGDYEEAVRQQSEYCKNVDEGTWGDYNKNFKEICKK